MAEKYGFLSNSSGHFNKFGQIIYFLPKKKVIQDEEVAKKQVYNHFCQYFLAFFVGYSSILHFLYSCVVFSSCF